MRSGLMLAGLLALTLPGALAAAVIGRMAPAEPISEARIAALPPAERAAWTAYLARSRALMTADKAALAAERAALSAPVPAAPSPGPSGGGGMPLDRPADWYASAEARAVADNIVSFQTPAGGWGKNVDRAGPPRRPGQHYVPAERLPAQAAGDIQAAENWNYVGTFDNNATTTEIRFLARVQSVLPGARGDAYRAGALKGLRYLLGAQFPNGGWPQVFPLQGGYHDAITYNDDVFALVATTLAAAAERQGDYAFVPQALAGEARAACDRAIALVLKTQVVVGGKRTIWGQQHDALTLAPIGARNFEPAALSANESAGLLMLLMRQPDPSPEMAGAIRDGVAWLQAHAITGQEWARTDEGRRLVAKPNAGPIWSRFYDLRTGRPIFGDRDRSIHDDVNQISLERRNGYSWFGSGPQKAIKAFAAWRERHPA